jgi:hypothetical protein
MRTASAAHVTLPGDRRRDYVAVEEREDGSLVVARDTQR